MAPTDCIVGLWIVVVVTSILYGLEVDGYLQNPPVHFAPPGKLESHCESDMFQIDCRINEVIVITHARYGRMRENRCISNAYGEIGCSIDVIDRLDATCSGRRHCDVIVASLAKEKHQACPKDFRSYLEISHKCIKVAFADETMCKRRPGPIELRKESSVGFLSNLVAEETGCGSFDSPWWLMVSPSRGQRLQLTIYEFAPGDTVISQRGSGGRQVQRVDGGRSDSSTNPVCRVYAVVKEIGETDGVRGPGISGTICRDASNRRGRIVYTSSGSGLVEIRLANASIGGATGGSRQTATSGGGLSKLNETSRAEYFVIAFEVIGCPELKAPSNGWIRRSGNNVTMGCDSSGGDFWRMKCDGVSWLGDEMRNCTKALGEPVANINWMTQFSQSKVSSLALVIGVATIVGVTIMLIGLFYLYSRKQQRHPTCADDDKNVNQSAGVNTRRRNRFPLHEADLKNSALSRKLLAVKSPVDNPNNQYAVGASSQSAAESEMVGSSRDNSGDDRGTDTDDADGIGRRIVLTSSGVTGVSGGNDYFHTLECASRSYAPPGVPYVPRHFTVPYQYHQHQRGHEPSCGPPPYMTSSMTQRPVQLRFDDDSAVGSASMITSEHIYESPKMDVRTGNNIPACSSVTSLAIDRYPEVTTVNGAVVEHQSDYFKPR